MPVRPGAYAWWQVVTLSIAHPGQDVLFVEPDELDTWPARALRGRRDRRLRHPDVLAPGALPRPRERRGRLPLEQVTLGGEPVDQAILTRLTEMFPAARVSWIYASSEAGATIAVHDGRAGFPRAVARARGRPGRATLTVDDGELLIASPKRGEGIDRRAAHR